MPCLTENEIIGKTFGKLEVIGVEIRNTHKYFECRCKCGNPKTKFVRRDHLLNGDISSCGCNYSERTHSKVNMPTYSIAEKTVIGTTFDGKEFIIDIDDFQKVKPYSWYFDHYGYAVATINGKCVKLHQFILDFPDSKIDHKNRKRNDNRKSNLRIISDLNNAINRSITSKRSGEVIGVYYNVRNNNWIAKITVQKQQIYLGSYSKFDDAVRARLKAEQQYFKEFAPQKHLYSKYLNT